MFHEGKWSVKRVYGDGSFWKPVSHSAPVWTKTHVLDPVYTPPQRGSARCMCWHQRCPSRKMGWHQPHSHRPQKGGFYPCEGGVVLFDCCVSSWRFLGHRHKPRAPNLFLQPQLYVQTPPIFCDSCIYPLSLFFYLHDFLLIFFMPYALKYFFAFGFQTTDSSRDTDHILFSFISLGFTL